MALLSRRSKPIVASHLLTLVVKVEGVEGATCFCLVGHGPRDKISVYGFDGHSKHLVLP
jgi:hypothetical protein